MSLQDYDESKDYNLGLKIQQLLIDKKLESPVLAGNVNKWSDDTYFDGLVAQFSGFLEKLGFDLTNDSINKTPSRVVNFFIKEAFYGLDYRNFPKISTSSNVYKYDNPLISSGISINSTCEHHLVSISGLAIVAYIPGDKIVGLSKINRVVDFFAKRPQLQERMTQQIFVVLQEILSTEDIAVAINATHNCIAIRGVKNSDTENLTIAIGGEFVVNDILKDTFYKSAFAMKCR